MAESGLVRVAVSGALGRMGSTLARLAEPDPGFEIVGGIDRDVAESQTDSGFPVLRTPRDAESVISAAGAVLDFSAPEFLRQLLERQGEALAGRALIVGTTGLGDAERSLLDAQAERSPVLVAANFSIGVNVLLALAEQAARALGSEYDIEVVEAHHRRKVDAPSGTALALGEAVARGRGLDLGTARRDGRSGRPGARSSDEIGFHAVRGGDVVGDHQVLFLGDRETIELSHRAADRALFAAGALRAARWLQGRDPGRYSMRDVLGLE